MWSLIKCNIILFSFSGCYNLIWTLGTHAIRNLYGKCTFRHVHTIKLFLITWTTSVLTCGSLPVDALDTLGVVHEMCSDTPKFAGMTNRAPQADAA